MMKPIDRDENPHLAMPLVRWLRPGLLCACAGLVLAACVSEKSSRGDDPLDTSLEALARGEGSDIAPVDFDEKALNAIEQQHALIGQAKKNSSVSVDPRGDAGKIRFGAKPAAGKAAGKDEGEDVDDGAIFATDEPFSLIDDAQGSKASANSEAELTDEAAVAEAAHRRLVEELARDLRARAEGSSTPTAALLQLAVLELLRPEAELAAPPDPALMERLSPKERQFLESWRELFAKAGRELGTSADVASLARAVGELAQDVSSAQPLALPTAALAMRVEGFGAFREIEKAGSGRGGAGGGTYRFIAGREHKAIVYIEVMGFSATESTVEGSIGYVVELSQKLRLYHTASEGDLVAWQEDDQPVRDFSRSRRRDFYTTQVITLPRNLTIGSYILKATVIDRASQAEAEAVIPIDIVAHESAMRE